MLKNYFDLSLQNNQFQTFETVYEMIEKCCSLYESRTCIIYKEQVYTYKKLYDIIQRIAYILQLRYNNVQDIIALYASDSFYYVAALLATQWAGIPCMVIPASVQQDELCSIIKKYQIKTILYTQDKDTIIDYCAAQLWQRRFRFEGCMIEIMMGIQPSIIISPVDYQHPQPDTTSVILFTSGTDGEPRGVELTHKNLVTGTRNGLLGFAEVGYNEDAQIYQLTVPLSHSFGLVRNLLCCFSTGSTLIISSDNKAIITDMLKYAPTRLVTVPGFCDVLISLKKHSIPTLGDSLEYIVTGGADLSPRTIDDLSAFNIPIYNGYGMTETTNLFTGNPYTQEYKDTIGHIYPNSYYKILDNELYVKGDNLFKGYFRENNENTFDNDGYFPTGDLVAEDIQTGLLHFIGRKKQIIVLDSGINIVPLKIERYLSQHIPDMQDCRVYSPDNKNLLCEYYTTTDIDTQLLNDINQRLGVEKVTAFIKQKNPLPKNNKMEVIRK